MTSHGTGSYWLVILSCPGVPTAIYFCYYKALAYLLDCKDWFIQTKWSDTCCYTSDRWRLEVVDDVGVYLGSVDSSIGLCLRLRMSVIG